MDSVQNVQGITLRDNLVSLIRKSVENAVVLDWCYFSMIA